MDLVVLGLFFVDIVLCMGKPPNTFVSNIDTRSSNYLLPLLSSNYLLPFNFSTLPMTSFRSSTLDGDGES